VYNELRVLEKINLWEYGKRGSKFSAASLSAHFLTTDTHEHTHITPTRTHTHHIHTTHTYTHTVTHIHIYIHTHIVLVYQSAVCVLGMSLKYNKLQDPVSDSSTNSTVNEEDEKGIHIQDVRVHELIHTQEERPTHTHTHAHAERAESKQPSRPHKNLGECE